MPKHLRTVGPDFFEAAPYRTTRTAAVAAPPAAVFAALADDPAGWGEWFPGFTRTGSYLSAPFHGEGAERVMRLGGVGLVETVILREEPTRWAFRVSQGNLPLVRAMAEDYRLAETPSGTALTWTLALDVAGPALPTGTVVGAVAGSLVGVAARRLERRLQAAARRA
jgi:carbon monoxide dehydrogenase subunit G